MLKQVSVGNLKQLKRTLKNYLIRRDLTQDYMRKCEHPTRIHRDCNRYSEPLRRIGLISIE